MRVIAAIGLAVVLLGGLLWAWLDTTDGDVGDADATAIAGLRGEVARLRDQLSAERDARLELAAQVAWLRVFLEEWSGIGPEQPGALVPPAAGEDTPAVEDRFAAEEAAPVAPPPGRAVWFNEEALVTHGVEEYAASELKALHDANQLAILELRNQAVREGWVNQRRFTREVTALRGSLRAEVGEDGWDRLLFATGRKNRVVITDVLGNSPAERAGFEPGDEVVRYGDQRVFNGRELQRATTRGTIGGNVPVDIVRGGELIRLSIPRGPMGTRIYATIRPPLAW